MAVYLKGLSPDEEVHLTESMWKSGITLPREHRDDYWIDKHSTGGVGDKTSLILTPLVVSTCRALFGPGKVKVPMISGRALGHSGGTVDKLESVPGFSAEIPIEAALQKLLKNDFFMMGQTSQIAPADRLIYAIRDITSTVECVPLVVSSIMSKKLAENIDGLVLDVKMGSGSFTPTLEGARTLAGHLTKAARRMNLDTVAMITRMDEPLGWAVGHLLEVAECADFLAGKDREKGLEEVVLTLASWMVHLASRKAVSVEKARQACLEELESMRPRALYQQMFTEQGGDWEAFKVQNRQLRREMSVYVLGASRAGVVSRVDAKELGLLVGELGGARNTVDGTIDPRVGIEIRKKVGDVVEEDDAILVVYHHTIDDTPTIEKRLARAVKIEDKGEPKPWVYEVIGEVD